MFFLYVCVETCLLVLVFDTSQQTRPDPQTRQTAVNPSQNDPTWHRIFPNMTCIELNNCSSHMASAAIKT